jgi:hypothetical protein
MLLLLVMLASRRMPTDHHDEAATISDENAFWEESQLDGQAFDEQEMTPVMPMEGADEGGASPSGYQSMEGANAGFGVTAAFRLVFAGFCWNRVMEPSGTE